MTRSRRRCERALVAVLAMIVASTSLLAACAADAPSERQTVRPTPPGAATQAQTPAPVPTGTIVPGPTQTREPEPSPSVSSVAEGAIDCRGEALSYGTSGERITITGDCPELAISGSSITIDAVTADIARLVVNGDAMSVRGAAIGAIEISGQANSVAATDSSAVRINGDRNAVETGGSVAVTIGGNDNTVHADEIAALTQSGDRNEVGPR